MEGTLRSVHGIDRNGAARHHAAVNSVLIVQMGPGAVGSGQELLELLNAALVELQEKLRARGALGYVRLHDVFKPLANNALIIVATHESIFYLYEGRKLNRRCRPA